MPTVLKRCDFVFVFVFLVFFVLFLCFCEKRGGEGRVDCSISPHHYEAEISI